MLVNRPAAKRVKNFIFTSKWRCRRKHTCNQLSDNLVIRPCKIELKAYVAPSAIIMHIDMNSTPSPVTGPVFTTWPRWNCICAFQMMKEPLRNTAAFIILTNQQLALFRAGTSIMALKLEYHLGKINCIIKAALSYLSKLAAIDNKHATMPMRSEQSKTTYNNVSRKQQQLPQWRGAGPPRWQQP